VIPLWWETGALPVIGAYNLLEWAALGGYELLLFAAIFFLVGSFDDLMVDLSWLWLRLTGRAHTSRVDREVLASRSLKAPAVVMIAAWQEAGVIAATVGHALAAWPQRDLRIYVGCYRNDPATAQAVIRGASGDPRLRLVIHDRDGPSSKADCLNRIYAALCEDERRSGVTARMVLLHDAEDMVDPAALALLDEAIGPADFAQIPVLPEPQVGGRWVAGHYGDEFAEAHGKAMVVRDALGAGLPAAGVGCAFARAALARIAAEQGRGGLPFASECLTEDYELGLRISEMGGIAKFIRARGEDGRLVATRACFPKTLVAAVRQKTRWIHGICFQGWDRLGWKGRPTERWMRMRDRRGPMTALVLAVAYSLFVLASLLWLFSLAGLIELPVASPALKIVLAINLLAFLWRATLRFAFTAREYGLIEGLFGVLRIPVANVIAIMAGRRALAAYWRTLRGGAPIWDKTDHHIHPALILNEGRVS
jgi:bacteriophage N4 adsorption protein B